MSMSQGPVPANNMSKSMSSDNSLKSGKISVMSVDRGETVMVVWNEDHNNYVIYTEPSAGLLMHFLHSESVPALGLTSNAASNGNSAVSARKLFATGEVTDKEYCQAKKPENRFKVPQGTKFFRVRCKPISHAAR